MENTVQSRMLIKLNKNRNYQGINESIKDTGNKGFNLDFKWF